MKKFLINFKKLNLFENFTKEIILTLPVINGLFIEES